MERKAKTRVLEVHSAVRQDILTGRLLPGEKISPSVMAQRYGVSLSVAREALTRLGEQGMVVSLPQQGFQVMPLSREDLIDLTSTRLDIETLAVRRSVQRGDVEWRSRLVAAHYVLENTEQYAQLDPPLLSEDWARAHHDFHEVLLSACGSSRLLEFAESLRDSAEVYRRWSSPMGAGVNRDIGAEHRAILEAVQVGDADLAATRLAEHIAHTTQVVLEHGEATVAEEA